MIVIVYVTTDSKTSAGYLHLVTQSLLDNHIIVNKPTKRGLPSYYITNKVSEDSFDEESEAISGNSIIFNHLFPPKLKDTESDLTAKKRSNEGIYENEIIESQQNFVLNLNTEIIALKSFVKDELYSLIKDIDRGRTEQCNQIDFLKEMKK